MTPAHILRLIRAARDWRGLVRPQVEVEAAHPLTAPEAIALVEAIDALPPGDPLAEAPPDPPGSRRAKGFAFTFQDLTILLQLPAGLRVVDIRQPPVWAHPSEACVFVVEGDSMPLASSRGAIAIDPPDRLRFDTRQGPLCGLLWFGMVLVEQPKNQTENQKPDDAS